MEEEKKNTGEKVTGGKARTMINNINQDSREILLKKKMHLTRQAERVISEKVTEVTKSRS